MSSALENLLQENRSFPPDPAFVRAANAQPGIHEQAEEDWKGYWLEQAVGRLSWFEAPQQTLDETNAPFYRWFTDGVINLSYNCLDRHLDTSAEKVAYHWIGEPGETRTLTYRDLYREVCRFANALRSLGLKKGDTAALYMGMVPELPVAMLACARIGVIHSAVFGGFSAEALIDRINDAQSTVVITQDFAWRAGKEVPLKANTDNAVARTPSVKNVIVLRRTGSEVAMTEGRDIWWDELVADQSDECEPERLMAEDPLYILYTSGTTGKPKGIVHTQGGYLTQVATSHSQVFDHKPDEDIYWCAADIG